VSRILITGGAGFIGTNLATRLTQEGHQVIVVDDLSSGYEQFIPKGAIFIKGGIESDTTLSKCFEYSPEYVVHLAALFANQNSVDHPDKDLSVNGLGTVKVLEWSKKSHVKKVLYSSSSCVYGNKEVMSEHDIDFHLDTPYAITKLLGEYYARFWSTYHNLNIVSVRLFNVYGPGDFPGMYRSVVPNFIRLAMNGRPLIITGTGNETRDFCYIDDTVDGICRALFNRTKKGEIFNIATGRESRIIDVASYINKYCNNTAEIIFQDRRDWDSVIHRQANIDKITKILGFSAKTDLDIGMKKTCDWMMKNT